MKDKSRRNFLLRLGKIAGVSLLSLIPGSFFRKGMAQNAKEKMTMFELILRKTNKENLYETLEASNLKPEEKLAIATVREVEREEVGMIIKGGSKHAEGYVCGTNCGSDCGGGCGLRCSVAPNAMGVFDEKGFLGFKIGVIDKPLFKSILEKAFDIIY